MITVHDVTKWYYGQANHGDASGLVGQVTRCEFEGVMFFVRENTNAISSFLISSSVRQGDKTGSKPSRQRQCLELAAPADKWEKIAEQVKLADPMKRQVFRSKNFTLSTAPKFFSE